MRDSTWRGLWRWIIQNDWTVGPQFSVQTRAKINLSFLCQMLIKLLTHFSRRELSKNTQRTDSEPLVRSKCGFVHAKLHFSTQQGKQSMTCRFWRNEVQRGIWRAKYNYYQNKVTEVERINRAKWWREIKKLTDEDVQQEWHH